MPDRAGIPRCARDERAADSGGAFRCGWDARLRRRCRAGGACLRTGCGRPPRRRAAPPRSSTRRVAVTTRTRPPAVTRRSPSRAVPAWKSSTPGRRAASARPVIGRPRSWLPGYPPAQRTIADAGLVLDLERQEALQALARGGHQHVRHVGRDAREDDLRLRIAEARVVLEDLGARVRDHEARVEHAPERRGPPPAGREGSARGSPSGPARRTPRSGRRPASARPCPPVLGPRSPS